MRRGSVRLRLFAAGAASVLLALAVATAGLLWLFERHVERRVVQELESALRQLVSGFALDADGALEVARLPAEGRFLVPLSGLYWQVVQVAGGPVLRSRSLWDATLELPVDTLGDGDLHRHALRGPAGGTLLAIERAVLLPDSLGGGTVRIAVAIDHAEITAAARDFGTDLLPAVGILAAVLMAAGWVQVTVGLRPLDAVRRRLGEVRAGRVDRLGRAFPDEVQPLVAEVDTLLDAQAKAIVQARSRAADLAHGLKTPLTVLAVAAEELQARGESQVAGEIAEVADSMRRHIERELARTRAGHAARGGRAQAVEPVVERVVGVLRRTPRGQMLDWRVDLAACPAVAVEGQDLGEMLGNLMENAVKWARAEVRIGGAVLAGDVVLVVEDDGPGIPMDTVGTALARGGRLDETQPGTGLGLAIVGDLVEAYGGTLTLDRSPLGGLRAAIRLPGVTVAASAR